MTDKNKTPNMIKTRNWIYLLLFGVVGFVVYELASKNKQEDYSKKAINASLKRYEQIKKTDLSKDLRKELIFLIEERKDCFAAQISYENRSATCKRGYVNRIVLLARRKIQSAPMRGLFIRCVRVCPIAGSLCSGEEGTQEKDCIETEARCIEYCLDKYWRGGTFPDGDTYTYKKNNEN